MRPTSYRALFLLALPLALAACGAPAEDEVDPADEMAFLDGEDAAAAEKADTGYVTSLDAREMELTIEADVQASSWELQRAPLQVGQFALTYFRERQKLFIQSLAEDYSNGTEQIEWQVGTSWKKWRDLTSSERSSVKHFRLTLVNAVLLGASKVSGLAEGKVFEAKVPLKPSTLMADAGTSCADEGHITASRDTYWYVWNPEKAGCKAAIQKAKATVTRLLPKGSTVYPEYDKLFADKKLDTVVFFGQVDDGALKDSDYSFSLIRSFERSLLAAGFSKGTATKGWRYTRVKSGITANVDVYGPREFAGLTDSRNVQNFYDAVKTHELVVFNGHSVLGASDFWANPQIYQDPTKYQIFLYNGCLGYEYYVAPILAGKQGAANVDIVSNVIETPFAIMVQETATAISMMLTNAEKGGSTSWQSILSKMNGIAGSSSFYGVSGARTNTFRPSR